METAVTTYISAIMLVLGFVGFACVAFMTVRETLRND